MTSRLALPHLASLFPTLSRLSLLQPHHSRRLLTWDMHLHGGLSPYLGCDFPRTHVAYSIASFKPRSKLILLEIPFLHTQYRITCSPSCFYPFSYPAKSVITFWHRTYYLVWVSFWWEPKRFVYCRIPTSAFQVVGTQKMCLCWVNEWK